MLNFPEVLPERSFLGLPFVSLEKLMVIPWRSVKQGDLRRQRGSITPWHPTLLLVKTVGKSSSDEADVG